MRNRLLSALVPGFIPAILGLLITAPLSLVYGQGSSGGLRLGEAGQPPVVIHGTVEEMARAHGARPGGPGHSSNLSYHGGPIQTAPKIYLVLWGSQWSNDPSNESGILQSFYNGVGGSSWLNSVNQYCQGVGSGAISCNGGGTGFAQSTNAAFGGVFADNGSAAPSQPSQSQLAAEAARASVHFGDNSANAQFVIATATGNNSSGFGTQYCAYHSSTTSNGKTIAWTNLPYITDAGASCGANFNGLDPTAGITIVGGHEMAETVTDPFPSSGWLDSRGAENADKCVWISSGQGAAANITLKTGTFAVQSLWSNLFNNGSGGCVP